MTYIVTTYNLANYKNIYYDYKNGNCPIDVLYQTVHMPSFKGLSDLLDILIENNKTLTREEIKLKYMIFESISSKNI